MTIYEFILKHSTYGKELFPDSLALLKLKRMTDEEKIKFLKDYDKKKKPKRTRKKVDNKKEKAYTDKTSGGIVTGKLNLHFISHSLELQ